LSPQLFRGLLHRNLHPSYNQHKNDIFSLGMVALEMASLVNVQTCYDFDNNTINFNLVNDYLTLVEKNYSNSLHYLIKSMLEPEEENRPEFE